MLPVKNNHPDLYDDIQKLFQGVPDTLSENTTHPLLGDPIYTHETYEKSHGRVETRCIKASTSLNTYLDWPGIAQGIQYRYIHKKTNTAEEKTKVSYGITSLTPQEASAQRLLELRRGHWAIENNRIGCAILNSEKTHPLSDVGLFRRLWLHCEMQHYRYSASQGLRR